MFDYIKRKYIEQRMYHEAFENDASYDEKNPMAKWNSGLWIRYKLFENVLASIPSADVIEPKRGWWIPCSKEGLALTELMRREGRKWYGYKCSNCNFIYKGNALLEFNFCPNCGCDMRERKGE